ncbi:MAG: phage tail tape measure protein [Pirellulales bacterium]
MAVTGAGIRAGRAFIEIGALDKSGAVLRHVSDRMQGFASKMTAIGSQVAAAGAALAVPLGLSVMKFAEFDDKMREVGAAVGATAGQLQSMTSVARELGATTSFTAVQVAGLMAELGRAGFNPEQVNEMTAAVLNLARATSTDATLSAGIMASALRQFNLGASEAARVADALTVAANASFSSVEGLGESLSYAGPVAADFGMTIEETLAILGALGNVGIQGSNAGTAVRRLLTVTAADAEKLQGIFGVSFLDAAGNARPLVDVLGEVNDATKEMATGERAAKFKEAFDLLGITSASAISKNAASARDLLKALQESGGAAEKTAKEMDAGIGGAFRIFRSAIEGVQIAIGQALQGELQGWTAWATGAADKTIAWVNANQGLVTTVAKLVAGITALGLAVTGLGGIAMAASAGLAALAALASPIGLLVAGAVGIGLLAAKVNALSYATANLSDMHRKLREEGDARRAQDEAAMARLEVLSSQQSLSNSELQEAAKIADDLQSRYGALGISIDQYGKKVLIAAGAQGKLNEEMQRQAIAQVNNEIAEAQRNLSESKRAFEESNTFWGNLGRTVTQFDPNAGMDKMLAAITDAEKTLAAAKARREALNRGDEGAATGDATAKGNVPAVDPNEAARRKAVEAADAAAKELAGLDEQRAREQRTARENEIADTQAMFKKRAELLKTVIAGTTDAEKLTALQSALGGLLSEESTAIDEINRRHDELEASKAPDMPDATPEFDGGGAMRAGPPPALAALEKGSVEAAKAAYEAENGTKQMLTVMQEQTTLLQDIAANTADAGLDVEEAG